MLAQRLFVACQTLQRGRGIRRSGNKRDVAMPALQQRAGGVKARGFMIAANAVALVFPQLAVHHHHRLAGLANDVVDVVNAEKARIEDDGVAAQIEQKLNRLALFAGAVFTVHQNQLAAIFFQLFRCAREDLAEVAAAVERVGDHHPDALGGIGREIARQQIGPVAGGVDGLEHLFARLFAHIPFAGEHARHGGLRDARFFGHFLHCRHVIPPARLICRTFYTFPGKAAGMSRTLTTA